MLGEKIIAKKKVDWSPLWLTEDWWTVWLSSSILVLAGVGLINHIPRISRWSGSISAALPIELIPAVVILGGCLALMTGTAVGIVKQNKFEMQKYLVGFPFVFLLAVLAYVIGNESTMARYGFNDVIWALVLGMTVCNVFGKPTWLIPALRTELFIKTGLILMGAEILFNRILTLGFYGLGVAWAVTPVVLFFMYQYGTRVLKIKSKSMVATVAACTSVCGVSAAIAAGAATKAKKEEISFAISVSLIFTIIMMVGMPFLIRALGLTEAVGGAWIGGTIDSTGAVVVAGSMLGQTGMEVAAVIKMVQNVLIGLVAFVLATLWVTRIERNPFEPRPSIMEIWHRFPKFILGFILASIVFSVILIPLIGDAAVNDILRTTGGLKKWLFILAFVSIGLDSKFTEMAKICKGKGPVKLYLIGQALNVILTFVAAWFFFSGRFFPGV